MEAVSESDQLQPPPLSRWLGASYPLTQIHPHLCSPDVAVAMKTLEQSVHVCGHACKCLCAPPDASLGSQCGRLDHGQESAVPTKALLPPHLSSYPSMPRSSSSLISLFSFLYFHHYPLTPPSLSLPLSFHSCIK